MTTARKQYDQGYPIKVSDTHGAILQKLQAKEQRTIKAIVERAIEMYEKAGKR